MERYDIGIIGAGVIGLSVAYQVLRDARSRDVPSPRLAIIDDPRAGQASWAGSGILPPPPQRPSSDPLEQLQRLSLEQMAAWSADLKQLTGIDNQYHQCGGYYLALSAGEQAALLGLKSFWEEIGTEFELCDFSQLVADQPWVAGQLDSARCRLIGRIPGETQLRNPRHLQALRLACEKLGATFLSGPAPAPQSLQPFQLSLSSGAIQLQQVVVAAGSWTGQWLSSAIAGGVKAASVFPVKGQILLYQAPHAPFSSVINFGTRYFVPRRDGHILVGSTEEEVGFDAQPTDVVRQQLQDFVADTLPAVATFPLVRQWAGFRPASFDNTPVIGRVPGQPNILVASGHFRSGIQWSIGTAICLAALLRDETPAIDLRVFRPGR